ncbi:hypothetical protein BDV26DRAFT_269040 [Aspergillus bertholletiae]|uniref:Uncharacterized protein n=1 Tax=Aspergillus bertholletiae TaxID=1226010 RepID=A0A5N7AYX8_9EURO|nr:hypothetical protein BDV26DRAFT_269040 [Aspergillus bertholletiae]
MSWIGIRPRWPERMRSTPTPSQLGIPRQGRCRCPNSNFSCTSPGPTRSVATPWALQSHAIRSRSVWIFGSSSGNSTENSHRCRYSIATPSDNAD